MDQRQEGFTRIRAPIRLRNQIRRGCELKYPLANLKVRGGVVKPIDSKRSEGLLKRKRALLEEMYEVISEKLILVKTDQAFRWVFFF